MNKYIHIGIIVIFLCLVGCNFSPSIEETADNNVIIQEGSKGIIRDNAWADCGINGYIWFKAGTNLTLYSVPNYTVQSGTLLYDEWLKTYGGTRYWYSANTVANFDIDGYIQ